MPEYLIGYAARGPNGALEYTPLWARTFEEERRAFERFMDVATATRERNPGAHIYHFAPYEPAALKRLMGRFATREVELDRLLRGGAFVDLHSVVRRSLVASVERYSIKDLEPFFGYEREQAPREAAASRRLVEHALEAGELDDAFDAHCRIVEHYNREDCESAARLRDWLEELRAEAAAEGYAIPRPEPKDGEASEKISELDRALQALRDGLLRDVPADPAARSGEERARFLLAHMMEFHRREDKASGWDYYRVRALEESAHAEERRAIVGLEFLETVEAKAAPLQRYRFPAQELDARRGDEVYDSEGAEGAEDAEDAEGGKVGTVVDVSYAERTIDIKKTKATAAVHPSTVLLHGHVSSYSAKARRRSGRESMREHVLADGGEPQGHRQRARRR